MARGDVLNLSLSATEREKLEQIAVAFGKTRGNSPNITGLVRAIATGELKVDFAKDSDKVKQPARLKSKIKRMAEELSAIESVL